MKSLRIRHLQFSLTERLSSWAYEARIRNLYTRINRSILVVADEDYITLEEADRLFNLLQAERIPVVMMRVTHASQRGAEISEGRSHYIKDDLTSTERRLIRSKLKNYVTEPAVLNKLDNDYSTLLIWMLTAFEKDFIGLDKYVHDMLKFEHLTPIDKLILEFATISLFFTKKALPYSFLADTFNLNGIQEVAGSIPTTSTNSKARRCMHCSVFLFLWKSPFK